MSFFTRLFGTATPDAERKEGDAHFAAGRFYEARQAYERLAETKGATDGDKKYAEKGAIRCQDAMAEVNRYTTWPTQAVSYIVGMREVEALRDEVKRRQGDRFDLARFHGALLRQGSLPPVLMRRAVLDALAAR